MTFELTLLGTNAAVPVPGRSPSAQVLQVGSHYYLIDCGEGSQLRMLECGIPHHRIQQIFISHLHGDHVFGLVGLMTTWHLAGRREALDVFAPERLEEIIAVQLAYTHIRLNYPVTYHQVETTRHYPLFEDEAVRVFTLPLDHRVPTSGFLFRERARPANMRPEKIGEYGIPFGQIPAIKAGGDFVLPDGRRIPHEELTVPAPPPRSFAYCSDTRYREALVPLIKGVDLLYHEATFLEDNAHLAAETTHSTALQAGRLAAKAEVGQLVLGHFSARYLDVERFAEEAGRAFGRVLAGRDGARISVPLQRDDG